MAKSAQMAKLQRRLDAIGEAPRKALQPVLVKSGEELADLMRQLAPVDEGDLKDSIAVTPPQKATPPYSQPGGSYFTGELEVAVTVGSSEVRYPHLQEFGTSHHDAQPFFWPAFRLLRKRLQNRIKREIRKAVREASTQ